MCIERTFHTGANIDDGNVEVTGNDRVRIKIHPTWHKGPHFGKRLFFLNLKYQSFVSTFFQSQVIHEIKKKSQYTFIHSLCLAINSFVLVLQKYIIILKVYFNFTPFLLYLLFCI